MTRGVVLPLTAQQRVTRMRWLAGEASIDELDPYLADAVAHRASLPGYTADSTKCAPIYYLLKEHNGGKDPIALDCASRWIKNGSAQVNRTSDCIGGMAWCGGFDRYQPTRFSHIYGGWINTDSMLLDARGPARCFRLLDRPEPGCFVVFASGSGGHNVGHIGGVVDVPVEWDAREKSCWASLTTVDVASRGANRSNIRTPNPTLWYRCSASFVVPAMVP